VQGLQRPPDSRLPGAWMSAEEGRQALRLLAVVGSVTPPGRLRRAVEEAVERVRASLAAAELIDLATTSACDAPRGIAMLLLRSFPQ